MGQFEDCRKTKKTSNLITSTNPYFQHRLTLFVFDRFLFFFLLLPLIMTRNNYLKIVSPFKMPISILCKISVN